MLVVLMTYFITRVAHRPAGPRSYLPLHRFEVYGYKKSQKNSHSKLLLRGVYRFVAVLRKLTTSLADILNDYTKIRMTSYLNTCFALPRMDLAPFLTLPGLFERVPVSQNFPDSPSLTQSNWWGHLTRTLIPLPKNGLHSLSQ